MSVIKDSLDQVADMMRTIPGLTVFVDQEEPGVDPASPSCALNQSTLAIEVEDYGDRMRASVTTEWAVRTATNVGASPVETSLDMIENVIKVFAPDNFPPGPICSLNVSASLGDARDPGSKYTEPTVTINFFVILDR